MKKKIGAFAAGQFSLGTLVGGTTIFSKPVGGGGGWGVSHTRTGPGRPPPPLGEYPYCHQMITQTHLRRDGWVSEKVEVWKIFSRHTPA